MTQKQLPGAAATGLARSADDPLEVSPHTMRRIGFAAFIGTVIEFYDFGIYSTAAALVFPHIFFPSLGTAAGTLASFATLGVAFVARPVGSVLFGHFGDRLGRKRTLLATLLIMGVATVFVGLLPTASTIGVVAPIVLIILRFLQGFAAGGEWAGGALFASENAPKPKRGFWAMLPSFAGGVAVVLASATFLVTGFTMSTAAFTSYGWRIPFLASIVLLLVGIYIRLRIDETPVFTREVSRGGAAAVPLVEAFRRQPRQIILGAGVEVGSFALLYLSTSYVTSYGTGFLHLPRTAVVAVGVAGGVSLTLGVYLAAVISDRIGRRRMLVTATASAVVWSLVLFPILDLRSVAAFALGVVVATFIAGLGFGPVGALMSELFHTRYRYTAAALCYNVAGVIGGAIPPVLAAAITAAYGPFAFGVVLAGFCLISFVVCVALKETRGYELDSAAQAEAGA